MPVYFWTIESLPYITRTPFSDYKFSDYKFEFVPLWYIGSANLTQLLLFRGLFPVDICFMYKYNKIPIELASWHSEVCNWTYYSEASFTKSIFRPDLRFFIDTNAYIESRRERVAMFKLWPAQGGVYPGSDTARRQMVFFLLHYGEGGAFAPYKYFPTTYQYYQGIRMISPISFGPSYFDCID
jgi:hypothetical protein